jgi:UPF0271 protein
MHYILDATALRSGVVISGEDEWYTTPSVIEEIRRGKMAKDIEILRDVSIKITSPKQEVITEVKRAAETTGDISRLSETDIEVLALALELEALIFTDDYSIQNLAMVLSIEYQPGVEKGITEIFKWESKCSGCARTFDGQKDTCPVCGSDLKLVRKK